MPDNIPVSFEYKGRKYEGRFKAVNGGGSSGHWHLEIEKNDRYYYFGQLLKTESGWSFSCQDGYLNDLAEFFGDVVTAWYE